MWLYDPLPVLRAYRVMWFTFVLLAVGACTPINIKPVASNCQATVTYTPEFQNAAADELGAMANHYPHVSQMIVDYGAERKALKACAQ